MKYHKVGVDVEGSAVQKISSGQIPDTWTKGHGKFGPVRYAPLTFYFGGGGGGGGGGGKKVM